MSKIINLNGIRSKITLCRIKTMGIDIYTIMRPITEEQENQLDDKEFVTFDGHKVNKANIYCYGEINVNSQEDLNYIKKFNIIDYDAPNSIHVNYNFDEGNVVIEGNIAKVYHCYNPIDWFKYNYLLIGKPKRIIIYKCKRCDL